MIAISAGHNPVAQGAYNATYNLHEHSIVSEIAELTVRKLELQSVDAVLVPSGVLSQKIVWINKRKTECAIDIHLNSAPRVAKGTECLYCKGSIKGRVLANIIQVNLVSELGLHDRGLKEISQGDRGWQFLANTVCPACITESLFLNNDEEVKQFLLTDSGINKIAKAHADALATYMRDI